MKIKNNSAFSLVLAMGLVLIMTLLVMYILEYIIPYSKNVKGIENSANAFYQAENSIEDVLKKIKNRSNITTEYSLGFSGTPIDYKYKTYSSGNTIPPVGEGNSDFDKNFNIISIGNPIQLDIGNNLGINWGDSSTRIYFKVPEINSGNTTLSGGVLPIINWQINAETETLNASGSWIKANEINGNEINLSQKLGKKISGDGEEFKNFYSNNCGTGKKCSLKFSILNKLELNSNNTSVPYLEYKITTDKKIPLRFTRLKSEGKSYGFHKYLEVKIPQQTTNEALDFTVFQ